MVGGPKGLVSTLELKMKKSTKHSRKIYGANVFYSPLPRSFRKGSIRITTACTHEFFVSFTKILQSQRLPRNHGVGCLCDSIFIVFVGGGAQIS